MTADRREHRYRVTFPDGRKTTLVCRPDELPRRLDGSEQPLMILDETAVAEWMPAWRQRDSARDLTPWAPR